MTPSTTTRVFGYDPASAQLGVLPRFGFSLTLAYIFVLLSRIPELLTLVVHSSLHIVILMLVIVVPVTILSGGLERALSSRICVLLVALTLWLLVSFPFSRWRGGTFKILKGYWSVSLLTCIVVVGMVVSFEQCRKAMVAMALALLMIVLMTLRYGSTQFQDVGRLGLEGIDSLKNSNDLAAILLMGAPFCLFVAMTAKTMFRRAAALGTVAAILVVTLRTGSRGALLAGAILFVVSLFHVSPTRKIQMLVALLFVGLIGISVTKKEALDRYRTLFTTSDEEISNVEFSAMLSQERRKMAFLESLRVTLEHPLVGTGAGNFRVVQADDATARGDRAMWVQTHNTFTQMSSENGIPALIIYVMILFSCFKGTLSVWRMSQGYPELKAVHDMGSCLLLSLLSYCITSSFGSYAYFFHWALLAGLIACYQRAARIEIAAFHAKTQPAAPLWAPPRQRVRPASFPARRPALR